MVLQEKYIVNELKEKIRLSDIEAGTFVTLHSRKSFKKLLKAGFVKLNGEIAHTSNYVTGGELIEIFNDETLDSKHSIAIDLEVLFEDDYLAIINKPAGVEISGNKKYTIKNALSYNLKPSNQEDTLRTPLPAHRLDYPTSGCLLIGKTTKAITALNQLFGNQKIKKTYIAITLHHQKRTGSINEPIDGKQALSNFEVKKTLASKKYGALNLVKLLPETGRRHQLRKHLVHIGNPIFGEKLYGDSAHQGQGNGLYLQAFKLEFIHPITLKLLIVTSPISKKFTTLIPEIAQILNS